jgi:putative nucleotidyltransferase with HDIG domain
MPSLTRRRNRWAPKAFVAAIVSLGCLYSIRSVITWHCDDPIRYSVYLLTGVIAAVLMTLKGPKEQAFSITLLLAPLGIVELSLSETITIINAAALARYLSTPNRAAPRRAIVSFAIETTAIAAAYFAYHSLVPNGTSVAIRLFLAGGAFFVANTFPAAVIAALERHARIGRTWKQERFWSFPHYFVGASAAGFISIRNAFLHWEACLLAAPVLYVLYRAHRLQEAGVRREREHFQQLRELHIRTIEALALTVEAKDATTGSHVNRVQTYAVELAKEFGMGEPDVEAVRAAALLHDVGKLAVPDQILSKPQKLTPQEFSKIKVHPIVGAEILEHARFPNSVCSIVRAHHEKWDGTGYPDGLQGEAIPVGARILAVVDCLDALASDRGYRHALSLDDAMAMVAEQAGTSYDPRVVELLLRRYHELERTVRLRTDDFPKLSTQAVVTAGLAPGAGFIEDDASHGLFEMAASIGSPVSDGGTPAPATIDKLPHEGERWKVPRVR